MVVSFSISEDLLLPITRQGAVSEPWWPVRRPGIEGQSIIIVNPAVLKESWVPYLTKYS